MVSIEIQTRGRGPTFEITHFKECPDYARSSYRCEPGCCDDGVIADTDCDCDACTDLLEAEGARCGCGDRDDCDPCDVLRANACGPPTLEQHQRAESYSAGVFGLSADSVAA